MPQESAPISAKDEHPDSSPTPIGIEVAKKSVLEAYEKRLIRFIIKYGLTPMFDSEGDITDILSFIVSELENDGIKFSTEIYAQMIDEALECKSTWIENFVNTENSDNGKKRGIITFECIDARTEVEKINYWIKYIEDINQAITKHFLNHRNEEISKIAVDLISERYRLSKKQTIKSDEERIVSLARRMITELKDAIVGEHIKQLNLSLKEAFRAKDNEKVMLLLKELNNYNAIKVQLAKELGERVVSSVRG